MLNLDREETTELIFALATLYPEQNAARAFWVNAGGEGAWFYHAPRGFEMWTQNLHGIDVGRTGHPTLRNLLKQALAEQGEKAAPLQKFLEGQHG